MAKKLNLPIYMDYASTTPVDPRVAEKMLAFMTLDGDFGNLPQDHINMAGKLRKQSRKLVLM